MAAYLTTDEAAARLYGRYSINAEINEGDLAAASDELDGLGPWIGQRQVSTQDRAFPRSVNPSQFLTNWTFDTNTDTTVPDRILDAVALLAYHVSSDEGPAVTSMSVLDRSVTYATPKISQTMARVQALVRPYQRNIGQRL